MQLKESEYGWTQLMHAKDFEWKTIPSDTVNGNQLPIKTCISRKHEGVIFEYCNTESLPGLFFSQVFRTPNNIAVTFEGEALSYNELANTGLHLANYLRYLGCSPDDCVGLFTDPSLEQMIGLWGIIFSGSAYSPLTPGYPPERLGFMIENAGIKIIFTQEKLKSELAKFVSKETRIITLEDVYDFSISKGHTASAPSVIKLNPENLAYIVYTSGSTGKPKGVPIEHRSVVNQMRWLMRMGYLGTDKTIIHKASISFDAAQWEMLSICSGTKLVVSNFGVDKNIFDLIDKIISNKVTLLQCVPTLLQALVNKPQFSECTSLTHILCGAESLTKKLVQQCFDALPNCMLVNLYGPSECTCNASFYEVTQANLHVDENVGVPIGIPVDNTKFYILDDVGLPVPDGNIGEICVSGVQVARGYLNRSDLTRERFIEYPIGNNFEPIRVYRTGDLAYLGSEGVYHFVGRSDTQVKIKGVRIELEEVKIVLESLNLVESAAVLVNEGQHGGKYLAACIQISSNESTSILQEKTSRDELVSYFKQKLTELIPDYMIPSVFVFVDSMPHTVNGKIDMRKIKALINERDDEEFIIPRNPTEEAILEIWKSTLGIVTISVTDDFFELGGNSLNAVDIILSINTRFNVKLPFHIIFTAPRIEEIAVIIDQGLTKKSSRLVCLQSSGMKTPIFCWPGLGGYPISLRILAEKMTRERPFYGIQAFGINEDETPYSSLKEMVSADIAEIRKIQKEGPYHLWGYSFGSYLAFEAAFQLEAMGEKVGKVVLLAPGMLKGLLTTNPSDEYNNKALIALLFTVFSRNVDDPDLQACLEASSDEASFVEFICQKYSIANPELVRRISKVVIESRKISREFSRKAQKFIAAPTSIFSALNDELSVFEKNADYFRGGVEIIKLDVTHFDFLVEPGINNLVSLMK